MCWGFFDDVAEGHVLALERGLPGRSYLLAGPPAALAEALRTAAAVTGTPAPVVLPGAAVRVSAQLSALAERVLPPLPRC